MFCWKCGKPLKGKFCVFCGANVEDDIINEVSMAEESTDGFGANDDVDIAIDRIISEEEFDTRGQRYTREQSPSREYRQTRERRPERNESHRRAHEGQRRSRPVESRAEQKDIKKKGLKPLFILVPLLILALVVAGWAFMGMQSTRAFNDAMEQGNRYLLAMDLEQAEAHFLRAVEISPREVEPYLLLADVYVLQDEVELAIDILEQGMEAVSESDREILEDKLEDVIQGVQPEIIQEVEETEEVGEVEFVPHTPSVAYFNRILSEYQWAERGNFVCDFSQPWFRNDLLRFDDSHLYYAFIDMTGNGIPELFIAEIGNGNFGDYNIIGMYGIVNDNVQPLMHTLGFGQNVFMDRANWWVVENNEAVQITLRDNGGLILEYGGRTTLYQLSDSNEDFMVANGTFSKVKRVIITDIFESYSHGIFAIQGYDPISESEYNQILADFEVQFPRIENIEWLRLSTAEIDFGDGVDHDNPFAGILAEVEGMAFTLGFGSASGENTFIQSNGSFEDIQWVHGDTATNTGRFAVENKVDDFTYRLRIVEYQQAPSSRQYWVKIPNETIFYLNLQGKDISDNWADFTICSNTVAILRNAIGLPHDVEHHWSSIESHELPISLPFHALRVRYPENGEFIYIPYLRNVYLEFDEANEPTLTGAEARHQRIMNGDFSDFAGTYTNGRGERLTLYPSGRVTGEWLDEYVVSISLGQEQGVFILTGEIHEAVGMSSLNLRLYDVGAPVHIDSGVGTGNNRGIDMRFERVAINNWVYFPREEDMFFKD